VLVVRANALGSSFLVSRFLRLWQEHIANTQMKSQVEPLRLLTHGLPGAGKSQLIKWIRSFFEDVLGWEHGREFVCIASMNTMAALIGGYTIHTWGEVPINNERMKVKAGSVEVMHEPWCLRANAHRFSLSEAVCVEPTTLPAPVVGRHKFW